MTAASASLTLSHGVDNIGWVTMNREDTLNAQTPEMMAEIADAVSAFEQDDNIRAIVLTGKGRAFSAGADLNYLETTITKSAAEIRKSIYENFMRAARAIASSSKPTLACMRGPAYGAGCEIAVVCDFRIISETAKFSETWAKLGLIPPLGGAFLLPHMIGLGNARRMILLGETVGAEEAIRIGLADRLVADSDLEKETSAFAAQLAATSPLGYAAGKDCLRRSLESSLEREWEANSYIQGMLLSSTDFAEGFAALKERRTADFKGV